MLHPISWSLALPYYSAALLFGYLLGSIPFGLILTKLAGTTDIRTIGSGNIGATNVLRTGRKGLAAATVLFDALKGTAAVLIMDRMWGGDHAVIAGLGAVLGHLFPIWLKFRGGKGVATYFGVLLGLSLVGALVFAIVFVSVAAITRYASLASLLACAATPIVLWLVDDRLQANLFVLLTILIAMMHRANIARLVHGTESKIGQRSEKPIG